MWGGRASITLFLETRPYLTTYFPRIYISNLCRVYGLGFRVRVWGLGFGGLGVWGLGFGVWGLGFGVQGSGFRLQASGFRV